MEPSFKEPTAGVLGKQALELRMISRDRLGAAHVGTQAQREHDRGAKHPLPRDVRETVRGHRRTVSRILAY